VERLVCPVIPEPIFVRFEARDDEVAGLPEMRSCMLVGRRIATTDVTALGATPQMKPPQSCRKTLHAACPAWSHVRINTFYFFAHVRPRPIIQVDVVVFTYPMRPL
jgi:hypothetical protein